MSGYLDKRENTASFEAALPNKAAAHYTWFVSQTRRAVTTKELIDGNVNRSESRRYSEAWSGVWERWRQAGTYGSWQKGRAQA
jgi:hypothetical protein